MQRRCRSAVVMTPPAGLSDCHADRFELGIHLDAGAALLAPEAGLLVAPGRQARVDHGVAVHPYRAGLDLRHQPLHRPQVVRPDAGGQPVGSIVGPGGDLVEIIEALSDDYGSEDLLTHDLHVRLDVYYDGGIDVVALV